LFKVDKGQIKYNDNVTSTLTLRLVDVLADNNNFVSFAVFNVCHNGRSPLIIRYSMGANHDGQEKALPLDKAEIDKYATHYLHKLPYRRSSKEMRRNIKQAEVRD